MSTGKVQRHNCLWQIFMREGLLLLVRVQHQLPFLNLVAFLFRAKLNGTKNKKAIFMQLCTRSHYAKYFRHVNVVSIIVNNGSGVRYHTRQNYVVQREKIVLVTQSKQVLKRCFSKNKSQKTRAIKIGFRGFALHFLLLFLSRDKCSVSHNCLSIHISRKVNTKFRCNLRGKLAS